NKRPKQKGQKQLVRKRLLLILPEQMHLHAVLVLKQEAVWTATMGIQQILKHRIRLASQQKTVKCMKRIQNFNSEIQKSNTRKSGLPKQAGLFLLCYNSALST